MDSVLCFVSTYPPDSDLSGGQRYLSFDQPGPEVIIIQFRVYSLYCMLHYICNEVILVLAPVVQRVGNSTQRINHYRVDSALCFDSDLCDG